MKDKNLRLTDVTVGNAKLLWALPMFLTLYCMFACGISEATPSEAPMGSLVIYSGRSESLVGPIIEQFAENSGIKVLVKYGGTAELAATLQEEGKNTPADVFFAQDPGGLGTVIDRLSPLPDDIVSNVPDWARAGNSEWVGISARARVIVYNRNNVPLSNLPNDLRDLTNPRWKGRIGWAPGNPSFQAMVTAMRSAWGDQETREFLSGLKTNDPQEYPKNTAIVAATASGEVDLGLVNHYYLHRFIQEDGEDFNARNHFLRNNGPGSLLMVSGAGVLEQSDNRENAEKFLRFMISTVAQQYFASTTFEYPLAEDVKTHRLLPPINELNNPDILPGGLADLTGTQALLRDLGIIP